MQATHFTMEELEAGLETIGESPRDNGVIEMIVSRPSVDERLLLNHADIDLGGGMVGDSWVARGSKSTPDGKANPAAQITLMNSRIANLVAGDRSRWQWAGDQFYVDFDISMENLPPGQKIAIGSVILEVSEVPHTGCAKFTERFGHAAIQFVNSPTGRQARRRGVNTRVVQGGTIRVGDSITKVE